MVSLRKLVLVVTMAVLMLVTLFPSYVKADVQLSQEFVDPVKNWSFEEYGNSACECLPWTSNNGGVQDLRSDINGDGVVDTADVMIVIRVYSNDPDFVETYGKRSDVNGDSVVDTADVMIVIRDFSLAVVGHRIDGVYSWYTSGGGDYQMSQELDNDAVQAVAGQTVMFSFYFYQKSVASDGSQNYARAEIYYKYSGGSTTICGTWIGPTELNWWNAYVTASLPSTVTDVKVVIHGKPDFKAWIDYTTLTMIDEAKKTSSYGNVTLTVATYYWFKKSVQPDGEVWFVPALHAESAAGYGIIGTKLKIELLPPPGTSTPQEGFLHIYYCHQGNEEGYDDIDPEAAEEMQLRLLAAGGLAITFGTGIALGYGVPFVLGALELAGNQFLAIFTKTVAGRVITGGAKELLRMFASDPNVKDSQEAGTNYVLEYWGDYPTFSHEYHPTPFVNVADGSANVQWLFNSGSADTFTIKITASVWWGEKNYYPGHYDGSHWELDSVGWTHAVTYMIINP